MPPTRPRRREVRDDSRGPCRGASRRLARGGRCIGVRVPRGARRARRELVPQAHARRACHPRCARTQNERQGVRVPEPETAREGRRLLAPCGEGCNRGAQTEGPPRREARRRPHRGGAKPGCAIEFAGAQELAEQRLLSVRRRRWCQGSGLPRVRGTRCPRCLLIGSERSRSKRSPPRWFRSARRRARTTAHGGAGSDRRD